MMNKPFNPDWVTRARSGDQDAITELYSCSWQEVSMIIRSMVRTDKDAVQDLMQDTFIKAFQRLDQLDNPEKYKVWVKQIARNTALDYLKKSKPILFSELYEDDSIPVEIEDEVLSHLPDVVMDKKETARLLHEILDSLPEGQRVVIAMHYLQEIPVKEVAEILESNVNTVKAQLSHGRLNLKRKIRELEQKDEIKLYGLSPLPFLLLLLRNMESMPMQPEAVVLGNILQTGAVTESTATATVADTAAKVGGRMAVKKVIVGITAAAVLTGGAVELTSLSDGPDYPEKDLFFEDFQISFSGENGKGVANVHSLDGYGLDYSVEPGYALSNGDVVALHLAAPNGADFEEYCETNYGFTPVAESMEFIVSNLEKAAYDYDILVSDYTAIIKGEIPIEQARINLSQSALMITPAGCFVDGNGFFVCKSDVRYSIVEHDINGDQINELIILEEYQVEDNEWDSAILDIFTFHDGKPMWLIAGEYRGRITLCEDGIIHMEGNGGAEAIGHWFYKISDGELIEIETAEMDWGTFYVNGKECTEELYWQTIEKYRLISNPAFEQKDVVEP